MATVSLRWIEPFMGPLPVRRVERLGATLVAHRAIRGGNLHKFALFAAAVCNYRCTTKFGSCGPRIRITAPAPSSMACSGSEGALPADPAAGSGSGPFGRST